MKIKEYSSDSLYANKFTSSKTNTQLPRMGMHIFPCKKGLYTRTVIQKKIFSTINEINRGICIQPFKKKSIIPATIKAFINIKYSSKVVQ